MKSDPRSGQSAEVDHETPPPRAFAQGTGLLLQAVGAVMFLGSGCVCTTAFLWDPISARPVERPLTAAALDLPGPLERATRDPGKWGLMLLVTGSAIGGLAFMVFGLGLQSEKPKSGWCALVSNVLVLAVLVVAGFGLWIAPASVFSRVWHGSELLVVLLLIGFTTKAVRDMLAHPPSGDLYIVPAGEDPKTWVEAGKPRQRS